MDHRSPLKLHTVLDFEGMSCHVEEVIGQGSNAIVYKGWYRDSLNRELCHHVLVKELFPYHPTQKIWRRENGRIVVEAEALEAWRIHKESFEIGNEVHLRLLADHPEILGTNLNSFSYNGTVYSVLGYTGGRSLEGELNEAGASLRHTARRMMGLLDALEAFHKSGWLHLDISPDNIMLVGREEQERIFLIDYNSCRAVGTREGSFFSCKAGYSAPEVSNGNDDAIDFVSDLYSVAAVFYRCLMGRSLTLTETLCAKPPQAQDSPLLQGVPRSVSAMVADILKKGLHTLPWRRYQSTGQMRQAFQELLDRIDCVGVTHWSVWENGKRSVEELIRANPSLGYLKDKKRLYPIRLEREEGMSAEGYWAYICSAQGRSGLILAQGGMGKTTVLLRCAMEQGNRYSPTQPAVFYISLKGWDKGDSHYIRSRILMRLRFKKEENTFDSAMHALHQLLRQTIRGDAPSVVLLLDGFNEVRRDISPLIREINELDAMAGVRILGASRSELPELKLETARLLPLRNEDIGQALGERGLLIPRREAVVRLLRTPLILSIYIQASQGDKQLDVETEKELLDAYLAALLEKECRDLPEDAPQRWQTDVALNYVLPAIAGEAKRVKAALTQEQLLAVVERCWRSLDSRRFRKAFPQWIGYSAGIRAEAENSEQWFGIVIYSLLWKGLGMLTKDETGSWHIFHQLMQDHLAGYEIPNYSPGKWAVPCLAAVLCIALGVSWQQYTAAKDRTQQRGELRAVLELGAGGYAEYGGLYGQLRSLLDHAMEGNTHTFLAEYDRVLSALEAERERTESEKTEADLTYSSRIYDGQDVPWGDGDDPYEYEILSDLLTYPDERAAFYAECVPFLKSWMESDILREKNPEFARTLSALLEADANLAAEMYHRAVGLHLSGGDPVWMENINALIAMVPELDSHRDTALREDRGQRLNTLISALRKAEGEFERESAKMKGYIRSGS